MLCHGDLSRRERLRLGCCSIRIICEYVAIAKSPQRRRSQRYATNSQDRQASEGRSGTRSSAPSFFLRDPSVGHHGPFVDCGRMVLKHPPRTAGFKVENDEGRLASIRHVGAAPIKADVVNVAFGFGDAAQVIDA